LQRIVSYGNLPGMQIPRLSSLLFLSLSIFLSQPTAAQNDPLSTKALQKLAVDIALIKLETDYGLIEFKEREYGITIEELRKKYHRLIEEAMTLEEDAGLDIPVDREILPRSEAEQLLIGLAAELHDGHTNIMRNTADGYTFGVYAEKIQDKLIVTGFHPDFFSKGNSSEPVQVGDEIVSINEVSVEDIGARHLLYSQMGTYPARLARAWASITTRSHRTLRAETEGSPVKVTFRRNGKTFEGHYSWHGIQALADEAWKYPNYFPNDKSSQKDEGQPHRFGQYGSVRSYFEDGVLNSPSLSKSVIEVGEIINAQLNQQNNEGYQTSKETRPGKTLDQLISDSKGGVKSVSRLKAYIINHEGSNLGVLRIPSYSPNSFSDVVNELRWIALVLERFESTTDGLIIDQVTNGGGYVYYVEQLLKFFAQKDGSMKGMTMNSRLSQNYLSVLRRWSQGPNPLTGKPPNFAENQLSEKALKDLEEKFKNGEKWSGPLPAFGDATFHQEGIPATIIPSQRMVYSKPVVIVNDLRSASGGDFFPSLMKKNNRAMLIGETSTGLGAPVYYGVDSLAGSEMFMRSAYGSPEFADGEFLENVGAEVDVYRPVMPVDAKSGFVNFSRDVLKAAHAFIVKGHQIKTIQNDVNKANPESPLNDQEIKKMISETDALRSRDQILRPLIDPESVENRLRVMKELGQYKKGSCQDLISEGLEAAKKARKKS